MFKIEINTDGAAFKDHNEVLDEVYEGAEIVRILRTQVIDYIVNADAFGGNLVDSNGNIVGRWSR
jgi:hypothetical protein